MRGKIKILLMSVATIEEVEKIKIALDGYNLGDIMIAHHKESARKLLKKIAEDTKDQYMIIGDEFSSTWLPDEEWHRIFWDEKRANIIAILKE